MRPGHKVRRKALPEWTRADLLVVRMTLTAPKTFPALPTYPMPSAVLFPGIIIPLSVSDPGERELICDALKKDRMVAIATINEQAPAESAPPTRNCTRC